MSDEGPASGANRINLFESGAIVWSPTLGAHAVYGLIGALYRGMGDDGSWLGPPRSDEKACNRACAGGRTSDFQNGHVGWCPGWAEARASRGPSGC